LKYLLFFVGCFFIYWSIIAQEQWIRWTDHCHWKDESKKREK